MTPKFREVPQREGVQKYCLLAPARQIATLVATGTARTFLIPKRMKRLLYIVHKGHRRDENAITRHQLIVRGRVTKLYDLVVANLHDLSLIHI